MDRRLVEYLRQIRDAVQDSIRFVEGMSFADFQADGKTQRAVTMNLVILGESAGKIEQHFPQFVLEYPESHGPPFAGCETVSRTNTSAELRDDMDNH